MAPANAYDDFAPDSLLPSTWSSRYWSSPSYKHFSDDFGETQRIDRFGTSPFFHRLSVGADQESRFLRISRGSSDSKGISYDRGEPQAILDEATAYPYEVRTFHANRGYRETPMRQPELASTHLRQYRPLRDTYLPAMMHSPTGYAVSSPSLRIDSPKRRVRSPSLTPFPSPQMSYPPLSTGLGRDSSVFPSPAAQARELLETHMPKRRRIEESPPRQPLRAFGTPLAAQALTELSSNPAGRKATNVPGTTTFPHSGGWLQYRTEGYLNQRSTHADSGYMTDNRVNHMQEYLPSGYDLRGRTDAGGFSFTGALDDRHAYTPEAATETPLQASDPETCKTISRQSSAFQDRIDEASRVPFDPTSVSDTIYPSVDVIDTRQKRECDVPIASVESEDLTLLALDVPRYPNHVQRAESTYHCRRKSLCGHNMQRQEGHIEQYGESSTQYRKENCIPCSAQEWSTGYWWLAREYLRLELQQPGAGVNAMRVHGKVPHDVYRLTHAEIKDRYSDMFDDAGDQKFYQAVNALVFGE